MMKTESTTPTVNSGSMADIAFLLLIFFLVTTTIADEKGVTLLLPPDQESTAVAEVHDRNLFKILINSKNEYLIEGELAPNLRHLRDHLKEFILNRGSDPSSSDSPEEAIISIKTNRRTDYQYFIAALDEAKSAYYDIYAARVGMTSQEYRGLDSSDPKDRPLYLEGKRGIPMNISIAEPEKLPL